MLKKRIIPILLLSQQRMVKGVNFESFRDTGDPVSAAKIYNAQNVDELVFIDIDANRGKRNFDNLLKIIKEVSKECFMPLTVGGGISSLEEVKELLRAGADKVVITTSAITNPNLIEQISTVFGKQCVIVGIDVKKVETNFELYIKCASEKADINLEDHIAKMIKLGAGEFFINSIDQDGTMNGFDLDLGARVRSLTERPIIIAGGSGNFQHLVDAFEKCNVDGVGCASIFHFGDNNPIRARSYLINAGIPMKVTK